MLVPEATPFQTAASAVIWNHAAVVTTRAPWEFVSLEPMICRELTGECWSMANVELA